MGEVNFVAIWMKNSSEGISLARQLGIDFMPHAAADDEE
jgi:hypothetical protein